MSSFVKSHSNKEIVKSNSNKEINNELKTTSNDSVVTGYDGLPKWERLLLRSSFVSNGIAALLVWNSIVSTSIPLKRAIWEGENFSSLLGGFQYSFLTLTSGIFYVFDGLNVNLIYIAGAMNLIVCILFPTVCFFFKGPANFVTGKWLLCCVCSFAGIASALLSIAGMSFASIMPFDDIIPLRSSGTGMAGVVVLLPFLLLSLVIFPTTLRGQTDLLFTFFCVPILFTVVQLVAFGVLSRRPWFKKIVDKVVHSKLPTNASQTSFHDLTDHLHDTSPTKNLSCADTALEAGKLDIVDDGHANAPPAPRPVLSIMKDCWMQIFNCSFSVIVSLMLFPTTGPLAWGQLYPVEVVLTGTFQIINTVTRYAPAFPLLRIRKEWLWIPVVLRSAFIPLFLLPARFLTENGFVRHPATLIFLMLLFSASHGWCVTLGTMYSPGCVTNPKEKAIAGKITVFFYSVSCAIGLYCGVFIKEFILPGKSTASV